MTQNKQSLADGFDSLALIFSEYLDLENISTAIQSNAYPSVYDPSSQFSDPISFIHNEMAFASVMLSIEASKDLFFLWGKIHLLNSYKNNNKRELNVYDITEILKEDVQLLNEFIGENLTAEQYVRCLKGFRKTTVKPKSKKSLNNFLSKEHELAELRQNFFRGLAFSNKPIDFTSDLLLNGLPAEDLIDLNDSLLPDSYIVDITDNGFEPIQLEITDSPLYKKLEERRKFQWKMI